MGKSYLVTGGTGFLGSALTRLLIKAGHRVRVIDDNSRGSLRRLADLQNQFEFIEGDVRDVDAVARAIQGVDCVVHLAAVNGTEFFYSKPDVVLEVGVKGIVNIIDGCIRQGVGELIVASSAEAYQSPGRVPTDETVALSVPDPLNPRYSYGASKLVSEVMALNFGRTRLDRVIVFRPHNIYGPDMGLEHVIPQFVLRIKQLAKASDTDPISLPIQGSGVETRAFCYIDDLAAGLLLLLERGEHLGIYHIGTMEEVTIASVAGLIGDYFGRKVEICAGPARPGGTLRRCPDISRMRALGYEPQVSLVEGISKTARWYDERVAATGDAPGPTAEQ